MKFVSIVGARPQFVKQAPLSRALRARHEEVLLHTGQHYDAEMSGFFFRDLKLPKPDYNLGVRSPSQGIQTGRMLAGIEKVLLKEKPDAVFVHGDTNSTLAGALAAAKLRIPVAHIEAGMRSFDFWQPEEINRVLSDHASRLLFCPTATAVNNLRREGITKGVYNTGDIMLDTWKSTSSLARRHSKILDELCLGEKNYVLATLHRQENVDVKENLSQILHGLVHCKETVALPLHPRTKKMIVRFRLGSMLKNAENIITTKPLSMLDMLRLEMSAKKIFTDSGGVQKEAYFFSVPCITPRSHTEWVETVNAGWNTLVGADSKRISSAIKNFNPSKSGKKHPSLFGKPGAAKRIVKTAVRELSKKVA